MQLIHTVAVTVCTNFLHINIFDERLSQCKKTNTGECWPAALIHRPESTHSQTRTQY